MSKPWKYGRRFRHNGTKYEFLGDAGKYRIRVRRIGSKQIEVIDKPGEREKLLASKAKNEKRKKLLASKAMNEKREKSLASKAMNEELALQNFTNEIFERLDLDREQTIKGIDRAIAELRSRLNAATCELKELREQESAILENIREYTELLDLSVREREIAQRREQGKRLLAELKAKYIFNSIPLVRQMEIDRIARELDGTPFSESQPDET